MNRFFAIGMCIMISLGALAQGTSINTTGAAPDPSAGLDVNFTDKGLLPPRLTTTQRDSIANPAYGLVIYNTDTDCLEYYSNTDAWVATCGTAGGGNQCTNPPGSPFASGVVPGADQITWTWSSSSGATGFKYNTTNDYASATDAGNGNGYNQTGLTCETTYTLYVWAYNDCGNSSPLTLTGTTGGCPFAGCLFLGGGIATTGYDEILDIAPAPDDGIYVSGNIEISGKGQEAMIARIAKDGTVNWSVTTGGSGSDYGRAIAATNDGGCIVAGNADDLGFGGADIFAIKLSSSGTIEWSKVIGTAGSDYGWDVIQTSDGNFLIVGDLSSEIYAVKIDGSGNIIWTRIITGTNRAFGVVETSDGGFALCGHATNDPYFAKLDANGNLLWTTKISESGYANMRSIKELPSGDLIALGYTTTYGAGGGGEMYMFRLSSTGSVVWKRTFGTASYDQGVDMVLTQDGNFVIVGQSNAFSGYKAYFAKFDLSGNLLWAKTGAASGGDAYGRGIFEKPSGDLVIGGLGSYTNFEGFVIMTDSDGVGCCTQTASGTVGTNGGSPSTLGGSSTGGSIMDAGNPGTAGELIIDCN